MASARCGRESEDLDIVVAVCCAVRVLTAAAPGHVADMSEIRPPASLELLLAMYKKDLNHIWVFACLNPSSDKGVCPEPGPTDDKSMEGARALCAMLCNTDLNPCVRVPTPHDAYGLG